MLTQATHDPAEALRLLNQTTDLAAAKHLSLDDAATKIGRTYNGNTKVLKEYGVEVTKASGTVQQIATVTKAAEVADAAHATAVQRLSDVQAEYAGKATLTVAEQIRLQRRDEQGRRHRRHHDAGASETVDDDSDDDDRNAGGHQESAGARERDEGASVGGDGQFRREAEGD